MPFLSVYVVQTINLQIFYFRYNKSIFFTLIIYYFVICYNDIFKIYCKINFILNNIKIFTLNV